MKAVLSRAKRTLTRRIGPSALVLTYHRVTRLECDPQLLAVSPDHFAQQLAMLSSHYRVIPLFDLIAEVRDHTLVDGTAAVTFDDGYADNLLEASPLLEAAQVPATVFVSGGYMRSGREFWWDELERLLLAGSVRECRLVLEAQGKRLDIAIDATDVDCDPEWTVLQPPACKRAELYLRASEFIRPLHAAERERCLTELAQCLGKDREPRGTHRPMTAQEVARIDSSPWVEVGVHSEHHEVLSCLSVAEQQAAISQDKTELEAVCKRDMRLFSYPFGGREDFTDQTSALVRAEGFAGAVANYPGFVKQSTDLFRIPRLVVRDWNGDETAARLGDWLTR